MRLPKPGTRSAKICQRGQVTQSMWWLLDSSWRSSSRSRSSNRINIMPDILIATWQISALFLLGKRTSVLTTWRAIGISTYMIIRTSNFCGITLVAISFVVSRYRTWMLYVLICPQSSRVKQWSENKIRGPYHFIEYHSGHVEHCQGGNQSDANVSEKSSLSLV